MYGIFAGVLLFSHLICFATSAEENKSILSGNPKYKELADEVQKLVDVVVKNFSQESGTVVGKMFNSIDEARKKCMAEDHIKIDAFRKEQGEVLANCTHRYNLEKGTWAVAIEAYRVTEEIKKAAVDDFCLQKKTSSDVVCGSSPDEVTKKFDDLKEMIEKLRQYISKLYSEDLIPFMTKCFDEEKFNSSLNALLATCKKT